MVHFDICNAPVANIVKSVNVNSLEYAFHILRGPCFNRQNLEIFVAKTILGKLILYIAHAQLLDFHVGSSRSFSQNSFFLRRCCKIHFLYASSSHYCLFLIYHFSTLSLLIWLQIIFPMIKYYWSSNKFLQPNNPFCLIIKLKLCITQFHLFTSFWKLSDLSNLQGIKPLQTCKIWLFGSRNGLFSIRSVILIIFLQAKNAEQCPDWSEKCSPKVHQNFKVNNQCQGYQMNTWKKRLIGKF